MWLSDGQNFFCDVFVSDAVLLDAFWSMWIWNACSLKLLHIFS